MQPCATVSKASFYFLNLPYPQTAMPFFDSPTLLKNHHLFIIYYIPIYINNMSNNTLLERQSYISTIPHSTLN